MSLSKSAKIKNQGMPPSSNQKALVPKAATLVNKTKSVNTTGQVKSLRSTSYANVAGGTVFKDVLYAIVTESSPDGVLIGGVEPDPIQFDYAVTLLRNVFSSDGRLQVQGTNEFRSMVTRTYDDFKRFHLMQLTNDTIRFVESESFAQQLADHLLNCLDFENYIEYVAKNHGIVLIDNAKLLGLSVPESSNDWGVDDVDIMSVVNGLSQKEKLALAIKLVEHALRNYSNQVSKLLKVKNGSDGDKVKNGKFTQLMISNLDKILNDSILSNLNVFLPVSKCTTCALICGLLLNKNLMSFLFHAKPPASIDVPFALSNIVARFSYWINITREIVPQQLSEYVRRNFSDASSYNIPLLTCRARQIAKEIMMTVVGSEDNMSEQYGQDCISYSASHYSRLYSLILKNAVSYAMKGAKVVTIYRVTTDGAAKRIERIAVLTVRLPLLTCSSMRVDRSLVLTNNDKDLPSARLVVTNVETEMYYHSVGTTNALTNALNSVLREFKMDDVIECRTSINGYLSFINISESYNMTKSGIEKNDSKRLATVLEKFRDMLRHPNGSGKLLMDTIGGYVIKNLLDEARLNGKLKFHLKFFAFKQIYIFAPQIHDLNVYRANQTSVEMLDDDYTADVNTLTTIIQKITIDQNSNASENMNIEL